MLNDLEQVYRSCVIVEKIVFMKTYLIIGASSGIGQATARQLISEGHRVIGTYNRHPQQSENELLELYPLDVMSDNFSFDFLPETLDGLIYCPGNISLRPFGRIKPEDFLTDYNLQVLGAVRTIQAALPKLKKAENPSVVLFS